MFEMEERRIRFDVPMPDEEAHPQIHRQPWRALLLVIKAKLEAVETGITCFDDEFMAHIVLPDGKTVGQFMRPQISVAYDKGTMPPLLPGPGTES